jgi:hypothetical protein
MAIDQPALAQNISVRIAYPSAEILIQNLADKT